MGTALNERLIHTLTYMTETDFSRIYLYNIKDCITHSIFYKATFSRDTNLNINFS